MEVEGWEMESDHDRGWIEEGEVWGVNLEVEEG